MTLAWICALISAASFGIVVIIQRSEIKRLERELKDRPVGRILSVKVTDEGLLATGEIWDPKVKAKLAQDMVGMSIGPFKASP